jgi:undecaprenyl-diphosphatase
VDADERLRTGASGPRTGPLPSSEVPNASPITADAPELGDRRRGRTLIFGVAMTFVAVLVLALALRVALEPFLARNGSTTIDRRVTDWFFTWRTTSGLSVMTRVSWIGGPSLVVPTAVSVTLALVLVRRWQLAQFFVITVVGAAVLNALAKAIISPRPPPGELGLRRPFPSSFPSGHAAEAAATYLGIGIIVVVLTRSRTIRVIVWSFVAALILAVCIARVYLAVHWTTDVLIGAIIGTLWALGMARAFRLRSPPADPAAVPRRPDG